MIGIGGRLATSPLPHHRAYGPVHGGSIRLSFVDTCEAGQSEFIEVVVAHGLLECRVPGHAPEIRW